MQKVLPVLFGLGLLVLAGSAPAVTLYYDTPLGMTGTQEVGPNGSPGAGDGTLSYDSISHFLSVSMSWSGLLGPTTVSHIHMGAGPGTNGGVAVNLFGFPPGVTSGTYTNTFDLTNSTVYGATFLANSGGSAAGAEAALVAGLDLGHAYLNIHTPEFPAGEIRGDLAAAAAPVPEPSSLLLMGLGALATVGFGLRRRVQSYLA